MRFRNRRVRHISLDEQHDLVKQFFLALDLRSSESVIELDGKPMLRVVPTAFVETRIDPEKLKAAVIARRDASRRLNADWEEADREEWDRIPK